LYSAWIEKLFDAPLEEALSWPALHVGLRDKSRNFLFNHLGLREDEKGLVIQPDCADLPYFLRGYFAFKMGLPFGYRSFARRRGQAAAVPRGGTFRKRSRPPAPKPRRADPREARSQRRSPIFAQHRQRRPFRTGERRPPTTIPIIIPCR
jgi:hypothetical protein